MDILVSHMSAFELLRHPEVALLSREDRNRGEVVAPTCVPRVGDVEELLRRVPELKAAGAPVELLVGDRRGSRHDGFVSHVWSGPLPPRSVFWVCDGVRCTSPELTALLVAPSLSLLELVVMLCELMGNYLIAPESPRGMIQRPFALTTREDLESLLQQVGPVAGSAKLRKALDLAREGSGSPRETKLALRLGMPTRGGGYGLPVVSLNESIEVGRIGTHFAKTGIRKPDILIQSVGKGSRAGFCGVAFEYDGPDHSTPEGVREDTLRGNELKMLGLKEYRVNAELYRDLDYMDELAEQARKDIGMPRQHYSDAQRRAGKRRRLHLYEELERIDGSHWSYFSCGRH